MHLKGQFAIEMFFAFTFAILLIFWLVNYLEVFSNVSEKAPLVQTQRLIARDIVRIANDVCVYGGNASISSLKSQIDAPCLIQRQQNWYYNISVDSDQKTLLIFSDVTNITVKYKAACILDINANLTSCSAFSKLCIFKFESGGEQKVKIQSGACP
ncbi:MAG: hypothetical protein AABX01_00310 [Candidatus Micrarchaeota archaeon]